LKTILSILNYFLTPLSLENELKKLAAREAYGIRSKNSLLFEDADVQSIFRWEVHSNLFFTKPTLSIIRDVRATRNRYGRVVKALAKVIEQMMKVPFDEKKVSFFDERFMKCLSEVEKYKEKRKEMEIKKLLDLEEKRKKEEIKEQKLLEQKKKKEKEESDKKIANNDNNNNNVKNTIEKTAKQPPVITEKDIKNAKSLEKQKNTMLSFFTKPTTTTTTTTKNPFNTINNNNNNNNNIYFSNNNNKYASSLLSQQQNNNNIVMAIDLFENSNEALDLTTTAINNSNKILNNNNNNSMVVDFEKNIVINNNNQTLIYNSNKNLLEFDKALKNGLDMKEILRKYSKRFIIIFYYFIIFKSWLTFI
jgi:hypothetical protein